MLDIAKSEQAIEKALRDILKVMNHTGGSQDEFQDACMRISTSVSDRFNNENWFFAHLPKKECADAVYGGGMFTYKYVRGPNPLPAFAREFNSEIPESKTSIDQYETANIANLSAGFKMDVDLNPDAIVDQCLGDIVTCVQSISDLFNDTVINGDVSAPEDPTDQTKGPAAFDGLDRIIQKESQHIWNEPLDLTGLAQQNVCMDDVTGQLISNLDELEPDPTFILGNDDLIFALSSLGQKAGTYAQYAQKTDDFGHVIISINDNDVSLVQMDGRSGQYEKMIIPTEKVKVSEIPVDKRPRYSPDGYAYVTKAYVGSFGMDAVQGLTLPGNLVEIQPPKNINSGNWVKKWSVEMNIGMAVMSRDACGMFTTVYLPKGSI